MEHRRFGNTDLKPSILGFGCHHIASKDAERAEVMATMRAAIESGINLFDTADSYGQGESERMVAEVSRGRRDRLILCTKIGYSSIGPIKRLEKAVRPYVKGLLKRWSPVKSAAATVRRQYSGQDFEPAYLARAVEGSLRRLETDYLDVLLLHNPEPDVIENTDLFSRLERLKSNGKIRHYGVSCASFAPAEVALAFLQRSPISVLQIPVNPLNEQILQRVLPVATERGVAVLARAPFATGMVLSHSGLAKELSGSDARTASQTAVRFALQQPGVDVLLTGMRRRAHLEDNVAALSAPPLTDGETAQLLKAGRVAREWLEAHPQ